MTPAARGIAVFSPQHRFAVLQKEQTSVVDTGQKKTNSLKFIAGVNDTAKKLLTGVNDTADKLR
jgi:hypothetical protein